MQFLAHNVAKVELNSTSATFAHNVARKGVSCVRAFSGVNVAQHSWTSDEIFVARCNAPALVVLIYSLIPQISPRVLPFHFGHFFLLNSLNQEAILTRLFT